MTMNYILFFESGELSEIKKTVRSISMVQGITLGVKIKPVDFIPSLYEDLSTSAFSYVVFLDLTGSSRHNVPGEQVQKTAEYLLPLLLDPAYMRHLAQKIVFLRSEPADADLSLRLTDLLGQYGLHNIKIIDRREDEGLSGTGDGLSVDDLRFPGADEYLNGQRERWIPVRTASSRIVTDYQKLSKMIEKYRNEDVNILRQDQYSILESKNLELKDTIAILTKNIGDLNNYYRYVRGETTFKHHNRDEQQGDNSPSPVIPPSAPGSFLADQSEKKLSQAYYNEVYESLPALYKKMATVIKILSGRRELLYYISKRHKKAFLGFVHDLPEAKQIRIWYYYEYEILPGWYKKLGKILAKRRSIL